MKNKSTLLKIRKNENFLYLGNPWRKKFMQKHFIFLKIRGIRGKTFRQIGVTFGIGR